MSDPEAAERGREAVARAKEKIDSIARDAKALAEELQDLAVLGKEAREAQKHTLGELAKALDTAAREGARARRQAELNRLDELIERYDLVLTVDGLSTETRDIIKGERTSALGKRARLRAQAGSDFGGVLSATEVKRLERLTTDVRNAIKRKRLAAGLLQATTKLIDVALSIVFKLAT